MSTVPSALLNQGQDKQRAEERELFQLCSLLEHPFWMLHMLQPAVLGLFILMTGYV